MVVEPSRRGDCWRPPPRPPPLSFFRPSYGPRTCRFEYAAKPARRDRDPRPRVTRGTRGETPRHRKAAGETARGTSQWFPSCASRRPRARNFPGGAQATITRAGLRGHAASRPRRRGSRTVLERFLARFPAERELTACVPTGRVLEELGAASATTDAPNRRNQNCRGPRGSFVVTRMGGWAPRRRSGTAQASPARRTLHRRRCRSSPSRRRLDGRRHGTARRVIETTSSDGRTPDPPAALRRRARPHCCRTGGGPASTTRS